MIKTNEGELELTGSVTTLLSDLGLIVHGLHDSLIEKGILSDEDARTEIMRAVETGLLSRNELDALLNGLFEKLLERMEK